MANIDYEILDTLAKRYDGDKWYGLKFKSHIIFTGLTLPERDRAGLPMKKPNPNFDENELDTPDNPKMIPMTNEDTTEIVPYSALVSFTEGKKAVVEKVEREVNKWRQKLIPEPSGAVIISGEKIKKASDFYA